jgi:hypothetical protein
MEVHVKFPDGEIPMSVREDATVASLTPQFHLQRNGLPLDGDLLLCSLVFVDRNVVLVALPKSTTICCNLIIAPDDHIVPVVFKPGATVAHAIARSLPLLPGQAASCEISDSHSKVLPESQGLEMIPEPRDLFVVAKYEFRVRLPGERPPLRKQQLATSKVKDFEREITNRFPCCRLASIQGMLLSPDAYLVDVPRDLVAVPPVSQGNVRIQLLDRQPITMAVDLDAKAVGLVNPPSDQMVVDDNGQIADTQLLRDTRGVLRCQPRSPPIEDVTVQDVPAVDDIGSMSGPDGPKHSYTFVYQEQAFKMYIPDSATVGDTKMFIAKRYQSLAEYVKLIHCGKEMKDVLVLSKQRIRPPNRIIVYIRDMSSILLLSCGAAWPKTVEKPPDYLQKVEQLTRESGQDPTICARAFTYFHYNYKKALEELAELD